MFPYTRLNDLLTYFISHHHYIEPKKLAKEFHISTRTLRNDIQYMNEALLPYDLQIMSKRGMGYLLEGTQENIERLQQTCSVEDEQLDSADRRMNRLIMKMLYTSEYLSMDDLADEVFVSTNTIINYLKTIRIILNQYQLTLQNRSNWGYRIEGDELNKRKCIIDLITSNYNHYAFQFSNEQKALLDHVNLEAIKQIVMQFNREHQVTFSDYNLKNLILHIALSISRAHVSSPMMQYDLPYMDSLETLLSPMIELIETDFQLTLTPEEKKYIYSHYISNTAELLNPERDISYIHNIVHTIIEFIYESYHFDLRQDLILEKDLCHHLHSILNAKCYSLDKKNPILNTIKKNYILSYEITETAINQVFSKEPFTLTEDEIGYISLHIGAAIERYFDERQLHKKKALIVYDSGYAVGNFIKSKLFTLFKDKLEVIKTIPSNEAGTFDLRYIDFIISTVPIPEVTTVPIVVVELPLLRKDIENITRYLTMDFIHPVDKITHFFDPDLFLRIEATNKEDVIHQLCELIQAKGYATKSFELSVLERERRISTVMDGVIATPHPLMMCSTKSKIAVGILDKPIAWSDKDSAQIILMLGLADDAKKDIEKLYDIFVSLMHNPPLQSLLLKTNTLHEFLLLLKEYISEDS